METIKTFPCGVKYSAHYKDTEIIIVSSTGRRGKWCWAGNGKLNYADSLYEAMYKAKEWVDEQNNAVNKYIDTEIYKK